MKLFRRRIDDSTLEYLDEDGVKRGYVVFNLLNMHYDCGFRTSPLGKEYHFEVSIPTFGEAVTHLETFMRHLGVNEITQIDDDETKQVKESLLL